jgi:hypothetical protein
MTPVRVGSRILPMPDSACRAPTDCKAFGLIQRRRSSGH